MKYDYGFAGMHILVETPFEIIIGHESEPFMRSLPDTGASDQYPQFDYIFRMLPAENDDQLIHSNSGKWFELRYYETYNKSEKVYFYSSTAYKKANAVVNFEFGKSEVPLIQCLIDPDRIDCVNYSRNICEFLQFEEILRNNCGLWLHASHIRWQGKGILFSGPSGIGKSTQADLWIRHEQAEILNGDKTAVRKLDKWMAYGLPYAGSSDIFRNEQSEISAIVCLGKGPQNSIRRMQPIEAFRFLYSQSSIHYWNSEFISKISDVIMELIAAVPVYYLECLPDQGAVETLKNVLQ